MNENGHTEKKPYENNPYEKDSQKALLSIIAEDKDEVVTQDEFADSHKHRAIRNLTSEIPDAESTSQKKYDNLPKIIIVPTRFFSSEAQLKKYIEDQVKNHPVKKDDLEPKIKDEIAQHISSGEFDKAIKLLKKQGVIIDNYIIPETSSCINDLISMVPPGSKPISIKLKTMASRPSLRVKQIIPRIFYKMNVTIPKDYKASRTLYGFIDNDQNVHFPTGDKNKEVKQFIEGTINNFIISKNMDGVFP
jgi:hypothetical protein